MSASTLAEAAEQARRSASHIAADARQEPRPALTEIACYAIEAMAAAVVILRMCKESDPPAVDAFVAQQTRLDELQGRIERLLAGNGISSWPSAPGTVFLWQVGESAIEAAVKVSRGVNSAALYARTRTLGIFSPGCPALSLKIADPKIKKWRDATMRELRTKTTPGPKQWRQTSHEILQDGRRVESLIRDEYRRAVGAAEKLTKPAGIPQGQRKSPLNERETAILQCIKQGQGLTAKQIIAQIEDHISDEAIVRRHIQAIRKKGHEILHTPGVGYHVAP